MWVQFARGQLMKAEMHTSVQRQHSYTYVEGQKITAGRILEAPRPRAQENTMMPNFTKV